MIVEIDDRLVAEVDAVERAHPVALVRPWTNEQPLIIANVLRFALGSHSFVVHPGAGEVHIPPAGDVEGGHGDLRPGIHVGTTSPEIIKIRMLHHLVPPGIVVAGDVRERRNGHCFEEVLHFVERDSRSSGREGTTPHPGHPLAHRDQKTAVADWLVVEGVGWGNDRHDCLQSLGRVSGSEPLGLTDVRSSPHADIAVAPLLLIDPLDGVEAVGAIVAIGKEHTVGVIAAPGVLNGDDIPALRQLLKKWGSAPDLVIGRADKHDRIRAVIDRANQVHRQHDAITHWRQHVMYQAGFVRARGEIIGGKNLCWWKFDRH